MCFAKRTVFNLWQHFKASKKWKTNGKHRKIKLRRKYWHLYDSLFIRFPHLLLLKVFTVAKKDFPNLNQSRVLERYLEMFLRLSGNLVYLCPVCQHTFELYMINLDRIFHIQENKATFVKLTISSNSLNMGPVKLCQIVLEVLPVNEKTLQKYSQSKDM